MRIVVTGATGHLGRVAVESLLARGVPAADIVAGGRTTERLADLAAAGVDVRHLDYDDPDSVTSALRDAQRVLLVSGSELGNRVAQHRTVIEAAARAGVELLGYTSIPYADTTGIALAREHRGTEAVLAESGVPHVLLRNSWYLENYTAQIPTALEHGAILGSAGEGRVSAAPRSEYAAAAAAAIVADDQAGQIYELGGDEGFTMAEFAHAISTSAGQPVVYRDLDPRELTAALVQAGLPEGYAAVLADADEAIARGELHVTTGDLSRLLGRPTTRMPDAVAAAVRDFRGGQ